ncbi:DUF6505 family protein [Bradyrhizobium canariense]|uniref:DUF6505 family protein n=1 Tax=Bradyrhizobium canariense TaxID=255045 RepID=UPI0028975590|nr:DUF6505 family protein [Bradyrhizobium canariense]
MFDVPAMPGEWAVSGAFRFCGQDPAELSRKARAAFRSGFLGVQSWGWSTLAQIVPATEDDCQVLIELLARQLVDRFGAPDMAIARAAAEEEVTFAQSLARTRSARSLRSTARAATATSTRASVSCNCGKGSGTARHSRSWKSRMMSKPTAILTILMGARSGSSDE